MVKRGNSSQKAFFVQLVDFSQSVLEWNAAVRRVEIEHAYLGSPEVFEGREERRAEGCWSMVSGFGWIDSKQIRGLGQGGILCVDTVLSIDGSIPEIELCQELLQSQKVPKAQIYRYIPVLSSLPRISSQCQAHSHT